MLQKAFEVTLVKPPSGIQLSHPLHIGLERGYIDLHQMLKNKNDQPCFVGSIRRNFPILYAVSDCIFVNVHVLESTSHINSNGIFIYVTEHFLEHYGYDYDDKCYFKPVSCISLDRIVFGAKTVKSFSWFQDPEVLKNLFIHSCKENMLCRQDDVFLKSLQEISSVCSINFSDYITLSCQPVFQGLINSMTSLTVADVKDISENNSGNTKAANGNSDQISLINLISYTSRNFLGMKLHDDSISSLPIAINLKFLSFFEIRVIPKLSSHFENDIRNLGSNIDEMNLVIISNTALKKLRMVNGAWIKISLHRHPKKSNLNVKDHSAQPAATHRLARVCCFSNVKFTAQYFESDEIVYITPLLWFNLNKHPSVLMQPDARLKIEPIDSNCTPPYAEEAYACLVQSPNYDGKINCDVMLSNFFSTPRYIRKGDMICTKSKGQLDFFTKIHDEDVDKLKWPIVHFRIPTIEGPNSSSGFLISNKYTRLYQLGTKQSYVPVTMETYLASSSYHPVWNAVPNGLMNYVYTLQNLILPFLKLQSESCHISSNILFTGPTCCGKNTVIKTVCRCLNLHLFQVNCHEFTGETSAVTEARLRNKIDKGSTYAPCIVLLKNIHCIGKEKEASAEDSRVLHSLANLLKNVNSHGGQYPVVVIGTTTDSRLLSSNLVSAFLHSVHMNPPDEEERSLLMQDLLMVCDLSNDVSTRYLAQRTAGFVLGDLCALTNQAIRNAYNRIKNIVDKNGYNRKEEEDIILASVPIIQRDLLNALEKLQSEFAETLGAPKIPNVKFEDVGGLSDVKQEILDTIQLPLEHPEILFSGLRRSGVLLYGPPGSGKTLLAKAVATECSLNFLSVKGPELINMYVGQSEENVRAIFNQARSAVPCIIFFDELDSLAPNRGRSGDSGGVMDRVVSQLLAELDGLNKKCEVFVIGATNRPDLIDPALLRPGRFDRLLYVGIPEDKKSKLSILKALTRKFPLAPDVNLEDIVEKCPKHLSGADFYSLCSNAVIKRVERNVELIEKGNINMEDLDCDVQTEDFLSALDSLIPSVSPEQYIEYQSIKSKIDST